MTDGTRVGVGMRVGVAVRVAVGVGLGVEVANGVRDGAGVGVRVGVLVGRRVAIGLGVRVGAGVWTAAVEEVGVAEATTDGVASSAPGATVGESITAGDAVGSLIAVGVTCGAVVVEARTPPLGVGVDNSARESSGTHEIATATESAAIRTAHAAMARA